MHDSRPGDYTNNIFIHHGEEASPACAGNYIIIDNKIGDDKHDPVEENQGPGDPGVNVPGQILFRDLRSLL